MVDISTRRTIARVGAVLFFLVLAGATYQGVTTALERRQYPRPGGMVDVGGHQLHIYCSGEGLPTVVLDAPAGGMSAAWGAVQPEVARVTRVCTYDRAGLGWSERGDLPYEPAAVVDELHTLLEHASEGGPFVLAGHGLGAAFAKMFASRFGDDMAALILVDGPAAVDRKEQPGLFRYPGALPWLARTGILRAYGGLCSMTTGLPQRSAGALCAFLNRPDHLSRTADELSRFDEVMALALHAPIRPDIPIARLDSGWSQRVAFLTPASKAVPVTASILEAVRRARNSSGGAEQITTADPETR